MRIYAAVYVYKRPIVLRACMESLFAQTSHPDLLEFIDDASGPEVHELLVPACAQKANVNLITKPVNKGAAHSGRMSLAQARHLNPKYFFPVEADYVFKPWAFATAVDVFENTEPGKLALGISGYDAPNFYMPHYHHGFFPEGMKAQVGEDNVNRNILHKPFVAGRHILEFVSNTHPTSYLNWHRIQEVASEFPELNDLLDQVMDPRDNPNYPASGEYKKGSIIDDGMLSHALSLCWNRWAIKHNIDRNRYAAWLNVKPSIAQNYNGGGTHTGVPEMSTDNGSPSWRP